MLRTGIVTVLVAVLALLAAAFITKQHTSPEHFEAYTSTLAINVVHKLAEVCGKFGVMEEVRLNQWFSRTFSHLYRGVDHPLVQTEHLTMAGTPVVLYHYMGADTPKKQGLAPAILFIHGGGWVVLNTDFYHQALQDLVVKSKLMVVSIEYTLAPDSLFPGPVHENARVIKHFINNAHKFGNDKTRIITMGDSAGGNLVAAVNLLLRDEEWRPAPVAQILIYPYLQLLDTWLPSYQNDTRVIVSKQTAVNYGLWYLLGNNDYKDVVMRNEHVSAQTRLRHAHKLARDQLPQHYFPAHYQSPESGAHAGISDEFEALITNPLFSPLMSDHLASLPRAFIQTCHYDVLRDDGYLYAKRLQTAGINVRYKNYHTSYHGAFLRSPIFTDDIVSYIREIL